MDASEDESDPLKQYKANFNLVMTHKEINGHGEPTTYYFRLQSKPTPRDQNPTWYEVTVDEGCYEGAISNWALETSEFLDIPGNRLHEVNYIKKVIRMWHESDGDEDFEEYQTPRQKKLVVKSPMVVKVGNHIIFVGGENLILKIDDKTGLASPTTPNELDVLIKYLGEKVKFSVDPSGNQIRVFGSSDHDENLTFTCDLPTAAFYLFEVVKFLNRCRAKEDQGSSLAFLLMASRTKMFDIFDQNQKLGIIQSSSKNTAKSFLLKLVGLIFDGKEPRLITGFTKYNIRTDLVKLWNIWLVDEPMATDPFDDLIKTNWSKSEGKIGKETTETTRRSSAIVAVNATIPELAKDYKLGPQTLSKAEYIHVGEDKVENINPSNFRTDLNACANAALLLHPHSACLLAAAAFLCKDKVTEDEMKELSPYCDGDERLTESVALFHRWWHFWLNVASEYNLDTPDVLKGPFDPRCLTYYKKQLLNLQPRNLGDLIELIMSKPEADEIIRRKGKKGPQGFVLKVSKVEECHWFEKWMSSKYKGLLPVQEQVHGKHVRQKLVSKEDVNERIWEKLEEFDALTVATLCSKDRAQDKEKNLNVTKNLIQNLISSGEELLDTDAMMNDILDTSFENNNLNTSYDQEFKEESDEEEEEELNEESYNDLRIESEDGQDVETDIHSDLGEILGNNNEGDSFTFNSFFNNLLQQNDIETNLDHEDNFTQDEDNFTQDGANDLLNVTSDSDSDGANDLLNSTSDSESSHGSNDGRGLYVRPRNLNADLLEQGDLLESGEFENDFMKGISDIIYSNENVADETGNSNGRDASVSEDIASEEISKRNGPITRRSGLKRKKSDDEQNESTQQKFRCDIPKCTNTVFKNEANLNKHRLKSKRHLQLFLSL